MAKLLDGTTAQSGHTRNAGDYSHERINFPVLGVVLNLRASDDSSTNKSAISSQDGRGSRWEAEVLILNDGADSYWVVPNAVILPNGPTGIDDFCEELPRPCSQMIDGSKYRSNMASIDPNKLDGDWVVVQFLGGKITQPIITSWFPHPSNFTDTSTQGLKEGNLVQGKRVLKRNNGVELAITPAGSVFLDTNNSGSAVTGSPTGPLRSKRDRGGDLMISVKPGRTCAVNFNPSVPDPVGEPSLPQKNPPDPASPRSEANTTLTMDKDFINAVAGQVVQLIGKIVSDGILLGETPTDHAIKGETHQATYNAFVALYNAFVDTYAAHTHVAPTGPTSPPLGGPPVPNPNVATIGHPDFGIQFVASQQPVAGTPAHTSDMPDADLSEVVKIQ